MLKILESEALQLIGVWVIFALTVLYFAWRITVFFRNKKNQMCSLCSCSKDKIISLKDTK